MKTPLDTALDYFLDYIAVERGLLANTVASYGRDLRAYIDRWGKSRGYLHPGDRIVFVTGSGLIQRAHNVVVVHEVE